MTSVTRLDTSQLDLATYHLEFLIRTLKLLQEGGTATTEAVKSYDNEYSGIRASLDRCIEAAKEDKNASTLTIQMVKCNWHFLLLRREFDLGISQINEAIENAERHADAAARAELLHGAAHLVAARGEIGLARTYSQKGVELADNHPEILVELHAHHGALSRQLGEHKRALRSYLNALRVGRSSGLTHKMGQICNELGNARLAQERYGNALFFYRRSYLFFQQVNSGPTRWKAISLNNQGLSSALLNRFDDAKSFYSESIRQSFAINDHRERSRSLHESANVYRSTGEFTDALDRYHDSLEIKTRFGDRRSVAFTLGDIAGLMTLLREYEKAAILYARSDAMLKELGAKGMPYSEQIKRSFLLSIDRNIDAASREHLAAQGANADVGETVEWVLKWLTEQIDR